MKETMIGHSVNFNTKKLDWNYSGGYITSAVTAYTALLHSFFSLCSQDLLFLTCRCDKFLYKSVNRSGYYMCISSFLPATDKFEFSHQLFAKGYPYYYVEKVYLNHFKELKG